jgi:hypothetical protein
MKLIGRLLKGFIHRIPRKTGKNDRTLWKMGEVPNLVFFCLFLLKAQSILVSVVQGLFSELCLIHFAEVSKTLSA